MSVKTMLQVRNVQVVQDEDAKEEIHAKVPESGESLTLKRFMLKPQKKVKEVAQRRNLF